MFCCSSFPNKETQHLIFEENWLQLTDLIRYNSKVFVITLVLYSRNAVNTNRVFKQDWCLVHFLLHNYLKGYRDINRSTYTSRYHEIIFYQAQSFFGSVGPQILVSFNIYSTYVHVHRSLKLPKKIQFLRKSSLWENRGIWCPGKSMIWQ